MRINGRYCGISFLVLLVVISLFLTNLSSMTAAASNIDNLTGQLQYKQVALNDPDNRNATVAKNTTNFLIKLSPTQNTYTRKSEILGIGGGNWAIVVNGTVVKNNPLDTTSLVSGIVVDFKANHGD
jgi:hypothetical protein